MDNRITTTQYYLLSKIQRRFYCLFTNLEYFDEEQIFSLTESHKRNNAINNDV